MHYGSKGWYVEELKKLGMTKYEGRKLQSYKNTFWPTCLKASKNKHVKAVFLFGHGLFLCAQLL